VSYDAVKQTAESFIVLSDFNAQNLAALLSKSKESITIRATVAPYGQMMQYLLTQDADAWPASLNGAVVWTLPQCISATYRRVLEYSGEIVLSELLDEVATFGAALKAIPRHIKHIFVPSWTARHRWESRRGMLDMNPRVGIAAALMRMNVALAEAVADDSRICIFDAGRWVNHAGEGAYDARMWYRSKTPFSVGVFKEAARDMCAALRGLYGGARKLLIVDLDDILWGGVVGEVGWPELRLGGHDPIGEAYRDFQAALKALSRKGALLAVISKNDEQTALEAIRSHPEMVLRIEDLAAWRINWNDKAQNVADLAAQLNLGLEAVVFIDDHPAERARVREALPEVLVPQWPESPLYYTDALQALDCFDAPVISAEDRGRTAMYAQDRERMQLRSEVPSLKDWLRALNLTIRVEELSRENLERAAQLLNKTNQMNLRTRRMAAHELSAWAAGPDNHLMVFRVSDKFGDYGLVGIGGLRIERHCRAAVITDFVLSCRVMVRQVERAMLHVLFAKARSAGALTVAAEYLPTARNQPCLHFLNRPECNECPAVRSFSGIYCAITRFRTEWRSSGRRQKPPMPSTA
jgi:FkbH-like protein